MKKTYRNKLNPTFYLAAVILIGLAIVSAVDTQISLADSNGGSTNVAPAEPAFVDQVFNPVIGSSNGQIVRSLIQADGKTIIVGLFNVVNGVNKNSIARFNTDGSFDTTFNSGAGPNDSVFTIAQQADGKLLIGGIMTTYNGIPVGRIARLNLDGTLDQTFNTFGLGANPAAGANNQIGDIKVLADGKIMIGGTFTAYNGVAMSRVARLNADGSLDTSFNIGTGLSNGEITVITPASNGQVYIGGNFNSYNGTVSPRLARINADGSLDSSFQVAGGANQTVRSVVVQPDEKVIVSGLMTAFGGFPANGVIRLNTNGSVDQTFTVAGIDAVVIAVALQPDGKMLLGGSFTQIAGVTRQCLVRVNADGTNDPTFDPGTSVGAQIINDLKLMSDGKFTMNGTFSVYRGTANGGAIKINADGTLDSNLANQSSVVGNFVTLTPQTDGKTIVGGTFSSVSGTQRGNLARLNADGSNDATFNVGGTGLNLPPTCSLVQPDGKIVVGGTFTSYNGTTMNRLVRLNSDGTIDSSFNIGTGTNNGVESLLLLADGKILVGGSFTTYNGATVNRFMRLNTDGSVDATFNTGTSSNGTPRQITLLPDGKIMIGGSFTSYNGTTRNRMARINADGTLDTTFDPGTGPNNTVNGFSVQPDGSVVIAGTFTSVAGTLKAKVAKLNANGTLDTTFDIGTGFGPGTGPSPTRVLGVENGKTLIAGNFTTVNGVTRNRVVRINPNGSVDPTFQIGQGAVAQSALTIGALTRQPDGQILIGGQFTIFNTSARSGVARFKNATDTFADFDGDGVTDISIMRRPGPSGPWTWWVNYSASNTTSVFNWGLSPKDLPQPYDFDGDGKDDVAMWRDNPESAYYIIQSSTNTIKIIPFGQPGDQPMTEDYDGDGKDDLSVWRAPAEGTTGQATWYYLGSNNNPNNNITYVPFGMRYGTTQSDQVDEPYAGDFDGDGRADFRVQRRADTTASSLSTAAIFYTMTATGNLSYDYFGWAGDRIIPGDYDGDGKTDIAIARGFNTSPGETTWYIRYTSGRPDEAIRWGAGSLDLFAQGDYDGDGITDLGVYRRAGEFNFYIRRSSDGNMMVKQFGSSNNDIPVVNYHNH